MNSEYFILLDIIGIIAFSISGFIVSIKNNLDLLGGFLVCTIAALGGGILRDLLANNIPFAFSNIYPLVVVLIVFTISLFSKTLHNTQKSKKIYTAIDSIGLVFFAIAGSLVAIEQDFHMLGVCLIALVTASGGGALRDIVLGNIPYLFKEDFQGMIAITIGAIMFLEHQYYEINNIIIIINMIFGLSFRYIVIRKKISMPKL